jgi:hypothetical protein
METDQPRFGMNRSWRFIKAYVTTTTDPQKLKIYSTVLLYDLIVLGTGCSDLATGEFSTWHVTIPRKDVN